MKPFSSVAIPHQDILDDKLTMDVFAANLWEVFKGRAPEEYQDAEIFFKKTYETQGLKNIIEITQKRLKGEGGDPVIQLQTPFGGGKTHTLIALYHKAKEIGAKTVVIAGQSLDAKEITIWEEMEGQLTGTVDKLEGQTAPGMEKIRNLLDDNQPVMILIDELLEYAVKAAGIKVENSNLGAQLMAFMQELTEAVATVKKAILILTLPSSTMEHYDEGAEILFSKLKKVTGRVERIYTPVQDEEIYPVIRRRIFSTIKDKEATQIVSEFMDYAENENLLPENIEKADYKKKFLKSYPFQPEVIDVLYKRWGSYPEFQRTRGVLRLLSLVVNALKESKNPIIRLSDFDLSNDDIKRELTRFTGPEFDSIIASDITAIDSGAKLVDKGIGNAYLPYSFGTKIATSIFLYSFSGSQGKKGISIREIKLSSIETDTASAIVDSAINLLNEKLFYIHNTDGRYFFLNQPNLQRMHLTKKEGIDDSVVVEAEKDLLVQILGKKKFDTYRWPERSSDIPDTRKLKLIAGKESDRFAEFLDNYGERPRVYRNTMIFLAPQDTERHVFEDFIKGKIAWEHIANDTLLRLTKEQQKGVNNKIKTAEKETKEYVRNLYRNVYIPTKEGLKLLDLGRHAYGMDTPIDYEILDRLKNEDEVSDKLSPLLLREKYLKGKDFVETKNILDSFFKTPGEVRISSDNVLKEALEEGVRKGFFGLGTVKNDEINCISYKESCTPYLQEGEAMIDEEICKRPKCPKISVSLIKKEYLKSKDYVITKEIFDSLLEVCEEEEAKEKLIPSIKEGVLSGEFGIGQLMDNEVECQLIEGDCYPTLLSNELIVRKDLCKEDDTNGEPKSYSVSSFRIKNVYLKDHDFVYTKKIFDDELKDFDKEEVSDKLKNTIATGVREGLFSLGEFTDGEPDCSFFKENCTVDISDSEIIINPKICGKGDSYKQVELEFEAPMDKVPDIIRMINFLKEPFDSVNAKTDFKIVARDGSMAKAEYDRIKETLDQLGIQPKKEIKK
ncbi:MAG: DUF499 domain-containing protein [Methanobacteriaceae archaeon]|nr:DUF499 domain-containing protein [Methanobacteriaceae archaeon]